MKVDYFISNGVSSRLKNIIEAFAKIYIKYWTFLKPFRAKSKTSGGDIIKRLGYSHEDGFIWD